MSIGQVALEQLLAIAADASSIAQATGDALAHTRAQRWLRILQDFASDTTKATTAPGGDEYFSPVAERGPTSATTMGFDGNEETCTACGLEGELACCDGCPRAFHLSAACLGSAALIPADDDESDWFCPNCTLDQSQLVSMSSSSSLANTNGVATSGAVTSTTMASDV